MDWTIGGFLIAALIIGIVEAAKEFGVTGKWSRFLACLLGLGFGALAWGIDKGLIPEHIVPYVTWAVAAVASALAAMGYYDLGKRFLGR